jgi:UDP-N-acetylglucosamine diphosphorylase / glucose-1-phosphate thymidylyltransferase / UDP-N-acetylgalactosamine diphosphorylase / glucosamine-1-phosphate N-acetyltransferase / galactosamine-1-phosphate N-acetyltransferase
MKDEYFYYARYFNLENFCHRDLFLGTNSVWEVLPKITSFISGLFNNGAVKPNYHNSSDIYVGNGTIIEEGAKILGPAIIGKNCVVRHAALIRENCLIGDNVIIGHATEVKNTILLNDAVLAHLNYVGDSIIGNNVNISGGVIAANFRLDKQSISVLSGKQRIDTGLQKFGAAIGDASMIGANAVLNPGTILGRNSWVYPLTSVKGVHGDGEKIK